MSFELDKDEFVVYEARRSWIIIWWQVTVLSFSLVLPVIVVSFLNSIGGIFIAGNVNALFMIFLLTWCFMVWNLMFVAWTDHYLDILIVTNKNLIDIEQKGLFAREVSVLQLDKIQDITSSINGFTETVLGYGDLHIQSAGNDKEFVLKKINNPNLVRSKIKEAISGEVPREE